MAHTSLTAANTILEIAFARRQQIDHMKLQKLLFFAHGFHLALLNDPLVSSPFEAWPYGPVNPIVYREFRRFGAKPIEAYAIEYAPGDAEAKAYVINKSCEGAYAIIDGVWNKYSPFSALQLSRMTHEDGSPWALARTNVTTVISDDLIKGHFKNVIAAP